MTLPCKIVYMGSPAFAVPALQELIDSDHQVISVFSQPPRPSGSRGLQTQKTPVHQLADGAGIPVRTPEKLTAEEVAFIEELKPDVIAVAAYGQYLPAGVLKAAPCLNIHPSALPRWRGAAPLNWTIMAGDATTDVCIIAMGKAYDCGNVYARKTISLATDETAGSLHDKTASLGAEMLLDVIDNWDFYKDKAQPQAESGITYASKIEKLHRQTDFSRPAQDVANHINGLSPFPAATTTFEGTPYKVLFAEVASGDAPCGEIITADPKTGLVVACGDGAVRLKKLQKQGKPPMDDLTFLCGNALVAGQKFGA